MSIAGEGITQRLDQALQAVAVIGAAGKMGRGIALLAAEEMARLAADAGARPRLHLIDTRPEGLDELLKYIEEFCARRAQRAPEQVMSIIDVGTDISAARESLLVFEAVPEIERVKVSTLQQLEHTCTPQTLFFTNTSSIPIGALEQKSNLGGRLVGFHFYNPPPVQELLELIPSASTPPELAQVAEELGRRLGKTVVHSSDAAGFIGNGHFIREGLYATRRAAGLSDRLAWTEAVWALNRVSELGLLRPMGIFQVIDYIGLDIFAAILDVMAEYVEGESFQAEVFDQMLSQGIRGGQHADGSQKDGFFHYEGRRIAAVYDPGVKRYETLGRWSQRVDDELEPLTADGIAWRELRTDPNRARELRDHFTWLEAMDHSGAQLTAEFAGASRGIGEKLVADGVAASVEAVNTVATKGFSHLYGPLEEYTQAFAATKG